MKTTARTAPRAASVAAIAICLATLAALPAPLPALACSCAETSIADWIGNREYAIFTGAAAPQVGDNVPIVVSQWFQGSGVAPIVLTGTGMITGPNGSVAFNTCGTTLGPGGAWIVVAHIPADGGPLQPGICLPFARLDTPLGQQMLAVVVARLGPGAAPSGTPAGTDVVMAPATPPATSPPASGGGASVSLLVIALLAMTILGVIGTAVVRRASGTR